MSIIEGARIIDRTNPGRRGEVMEVDGGVAAVEWRERGCETINLRMDVSLLLYTPSRTGSWQTVTPDRFAILTDRFAIVLDVDPGDLVQDIDLTGWQSVRRVAQTKGFVSLERLLVFPRVRAVWSEPVREEWADLTEDRWRKIDEIPMESGQGDDITHGAPTSQVCETVTRLCREDGRSEADIALDCWGHDSSKRASIATLRRAKGCAGYGGKDGLPVWPTERVVRGLVRGLRLPSMAVLFADSE